MKRIPTFVSDDNGSIIHIIKKTIKNYSSMKAMHLIIAMLVMMSLASCSADGNDPVENSVSTYLLEKTYGARSVTYEENNSDKLKLSELPAISLSEADHILSVLRKHTDAQEELDIQTATKGEQTWLRIVMKQTIDHKYAFTIQLNMNCYNDGSLYYGGYQAEYSSSLIKWYLKGFSLATDNATKNYKFESQSYIYMKVIDNGIKYMQIPVTINGNYNPRNHDAAFSYNL